MNEEHEEEILKLLRQIAGGIERIGAALAIQVSDQVKHEATGASHLSAETQAQFMAVESLRDKALKVLVATFKN